MLTFNSRLPVIMMIFLLGGIAPILADDVKLEEIEIKGKPKDAKFADQSRVDIWLDGSGWHFRAIAAKDGDSFTGKIEAIDGKFNTFKLYQVNKGEKPRITDLPAGPKNESKSFNVNFKLVKGSESGFDMKLDDDATAIKFTLKLNDKESPEIIFVGAKGEHPKGAEFSLPG